jgi:hypothetical protein
MSFLYILLAAGRSYAGKGRIVQREAVIYARAEATAKGHNSEDMTTRINIGMDMNIYLYGDRNIRMYRKSRNTYIRRYIYMKDKLASALEEDKEDSFSRAKDKRCWGEYSPD